jgi:hypothetical protein
MVKKGAKPFDWLVNPKLDMSAHIFERSMAVLERDHGNLVIFGQLSITRVFNFGISPRT